MRLIGTILERGAGPVSVATSEGVFRDGKLVKPGDASGYDGRKQSCNIRSSNGPYAK